MTRTTIPNLKLFSEIKILKGAEMRELFQKRDMFENENKYHQKLILTPYY